MLSVQRFMAPRVLLL